MKTFRARCAALAATLLAFADNAFAQAIPPRYQWLTLTVFAAIIGVTDVYDLSRGEARQDRRRLLCSWRRCERASKWVGDRRRLSFRGLVPGYRRFDFVERLRRLHVLRGLLVAYITVLLVIAEPCRNIGKFTLGDILAFRNNPKLVRTVMALSTITVSTFYLTAQMVGGGVLVKTLIGIEYEISVAAVGVLMLAYVLFGGMVATTWVQIIKAVLLVIASLVMTVWVWSRYRLQPAVIHAGRR